MDSSSTHKLTLSPETSSIVIVIVTENDDLVTSILCRLPTKSAVRFKSVCKHWLSLISHSSFSLLHTTHSPFQSLSSLLFPYPNNTSLFHSIPLNNTISTSTPSISLSFTIDPSGDFEIIQSCYGLLLCSSGTPWDGIDSRLFYVYNPTTKQFSTLPPVPPPHVSPPLTFFTKINLAFDPSKSCYYKVLLVRKAGRGTNLFRLDIYRSKTGGWSGCGEFVHWPNFEVFCKGVYLNGAVHWASKGDGFLCFDIERECFKVMPVLPDFRNGSSTIRYLGESSGKLYLVDAQVLEFDVFEMGVDYSGWALKFRVDLGQVFGIYPCLFPQPVSCFSVEKPNISLISVVSEGDDEGDLCLIVHVPGKILSYNLNNEGLKLIKDGLLGNVERIIPALVKGFGGYKHFNTLACV